VQFSAGHGGVTFEQALAILAGAASRELPKHLVQMPYPAHFIIVSAFIREVGPRILSIDNAIDERTRQHYFRFTSHQQTALPGSPSPRLALAGSGGRYLSRDTSWERPLLRLANAHDRDRVSDYEMADCLAGLNYRAHAGVKDGTVGPRCVVVWRRRPGVTRPVSGGAHQFYTGLDREPDSGSIPAIGNGMDVAAIVGMMTGQIMQRFEDGADPSAAISFAQDTELMNRLVAELPSEPDESLR
jgi:hypothetical protein